MGMGIETRAALGVMVSMVRTFQRLRPLTGAYASAFVNSMRMSADKSHAATRLKLRRIKQLKLRRCTKLDRNERIP